MKMKSIYLTIALSIVLLNFNSCNTNTKNITVDYKYNQETKLLTNCNLQNVDLISEAIYSFEDDITNSYKSNSKTPLKTYQLFLRGLTSKRFKIEETASAHSLKIAKALQQTNYFENDSFNLNSQLSTCIFNNIKDNTLKTSLNALKKANSLRDNVVLPTLINSARNFSSDKHLSAYLALNYYYNNLMTLNETDLKTPVRPENNKVDFNKVPRQTGVKTPSTTPTIKTTKTATKTGHEGHNHD